MPHEATPKSISELIDRLQAIRVELLIVQTSLEKMEPMEQLQSHQAGDDDKQAKKVGVAMDSLSRSHGRNVEHFKRHGQRHGERKPKK